MTCFGQVGGEVGELVGVQGAGRRAQLGRLHVRDERLAHRLGDFQQDLAVAVGLDQVPHHETLVARQRLEDVGDVRRVQGVELLLQLGPVLLVDERLHQRLARHLLLVHETLDQALLLQDRHDLLEVLLDALRRAGLLDFGHGMGPAREWPTRDSSGRCRPPSNSIDD